MKHTVGPWTMEEMNGFAPVAIRGDNEVVVSCDWAHPWVKKDHLLGNMLLILAAPDLLGALIRLVKRRIDVLCVSGGAIDACVQELEEEIMVIEKATGMSWSDIINTDMSLSE